MDTRETKPGEWTSLDSEENRSKENGSTDPVEQAYEHEQEQVQEGSPVAGKPSRAASELTEWIKALAIAGLLVFVIRWFLVSPFIVDGPSMEPSFWNHQRIIVNKIIYDIREPKRGEVIVFHVPEQGRDFIKRVIGVPGDTVKVDGDDVYINGNKIQEPYLQQAIKQAQESGTLYNPRGDRTDFPNSQYPDGKVPKGTLFVMGDHRNNSEDSRMIGFIPQSRVVGRADLVFWPLADFHFVSHADH